MRIWYADGSRATGQARSLVLKEPQNCGFRPFERQGLNHIDQIDAQLAHLAANGYMQVNGLCCTLPSWTRSGGLLN